MMLCLEWSCHARASCILFHFYHAWQLSPRSMFELWNFKSCPLSLTVRSWRPPRLWQVGAPWPCMLLRMPIQWPLADWVWIGIPGKFNRLKLAANVILEASLNSEVKPCQLLVSNYLHTHKKLYIYIIAFYTHLHIYIHIYIYIHPFSWGMCCQPWGNLWMWSWSPHMLRASENFQFWKPEGFQSWWTPLGSCSWTAVQVGRM